MGSEGQRVEPGGWKHFASVGAQLTALVGILVLGAVLETDSVPTANAGDLPPLPPPSGYRSPRTGSGSAATAAEQPRSSGLSTAAPSRTARPSSSTVEDSPRSAAAPARTRTEPPGAPSAGAPDLLERASRDAARLEARGPGYTLQLAMLCDAKRAATTVAQHEAQDELYVLPANHSGRVCFRLCWGHASTAEGARRGPAPPRDFNASNAFATSVETVLE